mgnify:CR=1 FL=1
MADYTPVKGFWQANASESAPSMATLSSQGYPTNGDPRKGTPATIPGAAWYYWVDQAIRAVIAASGKTSANPPSPTELRDALQSLGWLNEKSVKASMLDLDNIADSSLSATSTRPVQNKVINSALDGKLSLSGGTMTGDIQFADGDIWFNKQTNRIRGRTNDTYLEICPGPTSAFGNKTGASLMMTGRDYTGDAIPKGCFFLTAANEANGCKSLMGSPDGSLTWENQSVAIFQSVSPTSSLWHAKFNQGLILQGNNYHITHWGESTVTLPIAFQTTNYIISVTPYLKNVSSFTKAPEVCVLSQTTTSFTVYAVSGAVSSDDFDLYISYACIGY